MATSNIQSTTTKTKLSMAEEMSQAMRRSADITPTTSFQSVGDVGLAPDQVYYNKKEECSKIARRILKVLQDERTLQEGANHLLEQIKEIKSNQEQKLTKTKERVRQSAFNFEQVKSQLQSVDKSMMEIVSNQISTSADTSKIISLVADMFSNVSASAADEKNEEAMDEEKVSNKPTTPRGNQIINKSSESIDLISSSSVNLAEGTLISSPKKISTKPDSKFPNENSNKLIVERNKLFTEKKARILEYRRQLKLLTLQNTSKVVVDLLCDHQEEFCHGTLDFFKGEKEAKLGVLRGNLTTAIYESTISLQAACDFYKSQKDTTLTLFNKEKKDLENLRGMYADSCPTFVSNKEASLSELERVIKAATEQRVAVLNKNCEFWSECRALPQDIYMELEGIFAKNMSLHDIFTSSDYIPPENKAFLDQAHKNIAPTTFTAAGGLLSEDEQKKIS